MKKPITKRNPQLFTSNSSEWETPQWLFDKYNKEYNFTLDVCATKENTKCKKYFTKKENGLLQDWGKHTCWMNPPYGREIGKWVEKAYKSSLNGSTVVCLVPSRTDTRWWHDFIMRGEIIFLKGRLKMINRMHKDYRKNGDFKISSAPFPSAIVVFK